jgi:DNA-binding protein H-NS
MRESQRLERDLEQTIRAIEACREQELPAVIAKVREMIRDYDLTAADCGCGSAGAVQMRRSVRGRVVAPKYRDPRTGDMWSGRGKQPVWFREALAAGAKPESLKIAH